MATIDTRCTREELLVAGIVRGLAHRLVPDEPTAADRAATEAVRAMWGGASASEACRLGRALLESHARHPASRRRRPLSLVR